MTLTPGARSLLWLLALWALGTALLVALVGGCSSPSALQCRLDAVAHLPLSVVEDPDSLTVGDVRQLTRELKSCRSDENLQGVLEQQKPAGGAGDAGP